MAATLPLRHFVISVAPYFLWSEQPDITAAATIRRINTDLIFDRKGGNLALVSDEMNLEDFFYTDGRWKFRAT